MIEIVVVLWATAFDALRDRYYPKLAVAFPRWLPEQWRWHVFKWAGFYPPLLYIIWHFHLWEKILLAVVCLIVWRAIYTLGSSSSRAFVFYSRSTDVLPDVESPPELRF